MGVEEAGELVKLAVGVWTGTLAHTRTFKVYSLELNLVTKFFFVFIVCIILKKI